MYACNINVCVYLSLVVFRYVCMYVCESVHKLHLCCIGGCCNVNHIWLDTVSDEEKHEVRSKDLAKQVVC